MRSCLYRGVRIFYVGRYYPWDGGSNPRFRESEFSGKILDVKDGRPSATAFFGPALKQFLESLPPGIVLTQMDTDR